MGINKTKKCGFERSRKAGLVDSIGIHECDHGAIKKPLFGAIIVSKYGRRVCRSEITPFAFLLLCVYLVYVLGVLRVAFESHFYGI